MSIDLHYCLECGSAFQAQKAGCRPKMSLGAGPEEWRTLMKSQWRSWWFLKQRLPMGTGTYVLHFLGGFNLNRITYSQHITYTVQSIPKNCLWSGCSIYDQFSNVNVVNPPPVSTLLFEYDIFNATVFVSPLQAVPYGNRYIKHSPLDTLYT